MCMLCVVPPNVLPSREKLENSALNNPDGFGFAIVVPEENRIIVERTMNADKSINEFLQLRAKYPKGYALWHARYATHGSVDVENCHPFWVGKNNDTILAHNGVLPTLEKTGDSRSDTRQFAEDILEQIGGAPALDNDQIWNMLTDFSSGSKICVLTTDPRAKYQMYLMHADKGNEDESGVWWSNETYRLASRNTYYYGGYYDFDTKYIGKTHVIGGKSDAWNTDAWDNEYFNKDNVIECVGCASMLSEKIFEQEHAVCPTCRICQLCDSHEIACLCYRKKENSPKPIAEGTDK